MKIETLARLLLFPLAFAMTLALAPSRSALAQDFPGDLDQDGVLDLADRCPDTPAGDLVDPTGCSECPCEGSVGGTPWASQRAYVLCVVRAAHRQRAVREITRKEMKAAVKRARKTTCGNAALTRCCVYSDSDLSSDADQIVGTCRLTTADACDNLTDQFALAEDTGAGSCLPNPCVF